MENNETCNGFPVGLSTCGIMFNNGPNQPHDRYGCSLQDGHDGPHKFVNVDGVVWQWDTDLECDCEHCIQCEGDYCSTYWRADDAEIVPVDGISEHLVQVES